MAEEKKAPEKASAETQKTAEEKKKEERTNTIIKELDKAFFAVKFYPVATKEEAKKEALAKIEAYYNDEDETIKQIILFMIHESIAQAADMRTMHDIEHFKRKMPAADPGQLRINVYRSMFNYNNSIEGILEFISLLSRFDGEDAAKLLTYHFTFFCSTENESMKMLKNATIDALGKSSSKYALYALLSYAKITDNESTLGRIASALAEWDSKLDGLKISKKEKDRIIAETQYIMNLERGESHYG
jgi:hypothetical protein